MQFVRAENLNSGHPASFSELNCCTLLNVVPIFKVKNVTLAQVQENKNVHALISNYHY